MAKFTVLFTDGTFEFVEAESQAEAEEKAKEQRRQKSLDRFRYPSAKGQ